VSLGPPFSARSSHSDSICFLIPSHVPTRTMNVLYNYVSQGPAAHQQNETTSATFAEVF
jgi:hypothetical protein